MDPEYWSPALVFPFPKDAPLKEPGCCAFMMSCIRSVVVGRRVWWREPFVNSLPQLILLRHLHFLVRVKDPPQPPKKVFSKRVHHYGGTTTTTSPTAQRHMWK